MRDPLQIGAELRAERRCRQAGYEDAGACLGLQRDDEVDHVATAAAARQHIG